MQVQTEAELVGEKEAPASIKHRFQKVALGFVTFNITS